MCYIIYAILILLLVLYSDAVLQPLALFAADGEGNWMSVALGWERVTAIWPLLALAALVASLLTLALLRLGRGGAIQAEPTAEPVQASRSSAT